MWCRSVGEVCPYIGPLQYILRLVRASSKDRGRCLTRGSLSHVRIAAHVCDTGDNLKGDVEVQRKSGVEYVGNVGNDDSYFIFSPDEKLLSGENC